MSDLDFLEYTPTIGQGEVLNDQPGVQIKIPESTSPPSTSSNLFQNLISNAAIFGSQSGMSDEALRQIIWATNRQRQNHQNKSNKSSGNFSWFLNYLSRYFDVTTTDVVERIIWSAVPLRKTGIDIDNLSGAEELMAPLTSEPMPFDSQTSDKANAYQRPYSYMERFIQSRPDLYGPFWVSATLVFTIAILSNILSFAQHHSKLMSLSPSDSLQVDANNGLINKSAEVYSDRIRAELDNWHYSMDELSMSSSLVMIYVTMLPTILWFCFWFRGCTRFYTLTETVCAYGYSLSIFIPLTVMLTIQNLVFRYLMIALAASLSGIVLMMSFLPVAKSDPRPASSHIILAIIPLFQFGFAYLIHRIMMSNK